MMYKVLQIQQQQRLWREIAQWQGRRPIDHWDWHLRGGRDVARPQARPIKSASLEVR